jgi:hypothetical protein
MNWPSQAQPRGPNRASTTELDNTNTSLNAILNAILVRVLNKGAFVAVGRRYLAVVGISSVLARTVRRDVSSPLAWTQWLAWPATRWSIARMVQKLDLAETLRSCQAGFQGRDLNATR